MNTRTLFFILFIWLSGIYTVHVNADEYDWPRWRGPNRDGISMETDWDTEAFTEGPKILWKADVGRGYSNVAIKDNRLYTMGQESRENIVFCLNAETGKVIWQHSLQQMKNS